MKLRFVLQLGPETRPHTRQFAGRIEEVDTGREVRFRSTEELLDFLGRCFESALRHPAESVGDGDDETRR
jgi:hypothetical protein